MKPVTIYFPVKVLKQIDDIAKKYSISRSELVREMAIFYLEQGGRESFIHQEIDIIKRQLDTIIKKLPADE